MEQKKRYSEAELEIILFGTPGKYSDIITTSGGDSDSSDGTLDGDSWDT